MLRKIFFSCLLSTILFSRLEVHAGVNVHATPVSVVQAIFTAAKTGNYAALSGLCDPSQQGDGDTKMICSMNDQNSEVKREFRQHFKTGRIIGKAVIKGETATVKIKFGPEGKDDEEFHLLRVEDKWYLVSY